MTRLPPDPETVILDSIDLIPQGIADEEIPDDIPHACVDVEAEAYHRWMVTYRSVTGYTRLLRYFLSTQLLDLRPDDRLLDVGAGDLVYRSITSTLVAVCCTNDIELQGSDEGPSYAGDVCTIALPENSFTKINIGHTFEHLRGNRDRQTLEVVARLLRKGGRCCIEPLFLGKRYVEVFNHDTEDHYDLRAEKIRTYESNFPGSRSGHMGFARIYDLEALRARVLQPLDALRLRYRVYSFKHRGQLLPDMSCYAFKRRAINFPLRLLLIEA